MKDESIMQMVLNLRHRVHPDWENVIWVVDQITWTQMLMAGYHTQVDNTVGIAEYLGLPVKVVCSPKFKGVRSSKTIPAMEEDFHRVLSIEYLDKGIGRTCYLNSPLTDELFRTTSQSVT